MSEQGSGGGDDNDEIKRMREWQLQCKLQRYRQAQIDQVHMQKIYREQDERRAREQKEEERRTKWMEDVRARGWPKRKTWLAIWCLMGLVMLLVHGILLAMVVGNLVNSLIVIVSSGLSTLAFYWMANAYPSDDPDVVQDPLTLSLERNFLSCCRPRQQADL